MIITNVKLSPFLSDKELYLECIKKSKIPQNEVTSFKILKRSLDARDKKNIHYIYTIAINEKEQIISLPTITKQVSPLIIGSGPAGLFCGLYLARMGAKPIIIERGSSANVRKSKIDKFYSTGILDINSNIQFGEGGAGTFSDGKLNTGIKSEYISWILKDFVKAGADKDIEFSNKPHIGSDVLPIVVENMRKEIISLGGQYVFDSTLTNIKIENGQAISITTTTGEHPVSDLILAIGHSSRDTYQMLNNLGVILEQKPFAIGVRIEHLREDINVNQYGKNYDKRLPTADYKCTANVNGRGVFTFCMCPGGYVVPATSEMGNSVCNGMSLRARDGANSNSAVIVQVDSSDFGEGLFNGIDFQENLEKKAYKMGGGNYVAPIQTFKGFLNGENLLPSKVKPTYSRGYELCNLNHLLPYKISESLKGGIMDFSKRMPIFADGSSILTGVETRTSSPLRMTRDENRLCVGFSNIYPIGEGAGYAGGITSSAVDGVKTALKIANKYL